MHDYTARVTTVKEMRKESSTKYFPIIDFNKKNIYKELDMREGARSKEKRKSQSCEQKVKFKEINCWHYCCAFFQGELSPPFRLTQSIANFSSLSLLLINNNNENRSWKLRRREREWACGWMNNWLCTIYECQWLNVADKSLLVWLMTSS